MEATGHYKLKIGDKAPDFRLKATDGKEYCLKDFDKDLLVVFFFCNHCPYANAYEERIMELAEEFDDTADFAGINSNDDEGYPEDSFERMVERANEKEYNFTYLRDSTQEVAKAFGGECTPHFLLFDKDRKLRYQGRLDDNWENPEHVEETELREAMLTVLEDHKVPTELTNAIGCSIKWKPKKDS